MAVSNDIPWLGFSTADIRGAQAPDAPVCLAAGREGDVDKAGPTAVPATCSTYSFYLPGHPVRPMEGSARGRRPQSHWSLPCHSARRTALPRHHPHGLGGTALFPRSPPSLLSFRAPLSLQPGPVSLSRRLGPPLAQAAVPSPPALCRSVPLPVQVGAAACPAASLETRGAMLGVGGGGLRMVFSSQRFLTTLQSEAV